MKIKEIINESSMSGRITTPSKVGREFQHLEDLVYINGSSGIKEAVRRLTDISKSSKSLEVKWDGSPAIIFGRDENGNFHFGDKYNKKHSSSGDDVYKQLANRKKAMDSERTKFATNMSGLYEIYEKITPKNFRGYIEAGLLYSGQPEVNSRGEYTFTPNTVSYNIGAETELGKRIANSLSGCAATAFFDKIPGQGGRRMPVGDKLKNFTNPLVLIIPPKFVSTPIDIRSDRLQKILKVANKYGDYIDKFVEGDDAKATIYKYVNSQVDTPDGLSTLGDNFAEWLESSGDLQKENILGRLQDNPRGADAMFKLTRVIMAIKNDIIAQAETPTLADLGIRAELRNGKSGGEGFVHDDPTNGPVKLVNRGTFSKDNRTLSESIDRTGKSKSAVISWGRGMGHKGHCYLASAVLTTAKEKSADPYVFLSRKFDDENPLDTDTKLWIYKKVFPEVPDVFQVATDEMPDLSSILINLYDTGYKNITVIVGDDQVEDFQYVAERNGKGGYKFNDIQVISRSDTNDEYADEAGPRATPMREILKKPKASTQQKFKIWRDAMPDVLNDSQVMKLMGIAAKNMGVPIEGDLNEADVPPQGSLFSPLSMTTRDKPRVDPKIAARKRKAERRMRQFMGHTD